LEKERLIELSDAANIDDLYSYCYRPKRTIIEVMQDFSCSNKTPNPIKCPSGYTEFSLKSNLPMTPSTHFQDTRTFSNHFLRDRITKMILVCLSLTIRFYGTNCVSVNNPLFINRISRFPISINQPFEVSIKPVDKKVQFGFSFLGPIVIQLVDETGSDNEVAVLEFDLKDPLERDFKGEYIRIQPWERNIEKRTINITLYFTKLSFDQSIAFYHINASSTKERRNMLNDLKLAENLYRSKIVIVEPPKIDLYLTYDKHRAMEYKSQKMYTIVCQSLEEPSKIELYFDFENNVWKFPVLFNKLRSKLLFVDWYLIIQYYYVIYVNFHFIIIFYRQVPDLRKIKSECLKNNYIYKSFTITL